MNRDEFDDDQTPRVIDVGDELDDDNEIDTFTRYFSQSCVSTYDAPTLH